jgi:hypothetical protein
MNSGFTYCSVYTLTPVQPLTGGATFLRHPITRLLRNQIPRSTLAYPPEGFNTRLWVVSINRLILGARARVREYQPVVHRLRLTASP